MSYCTNMVIQRLQVNKFKIYIHLDKFQFIKLIQIRQI